MAAPTCSEPDNDSIDQLGRDLAAVLDTLAPRGPIVLVGHSMGGMAVLALAAQRPELFARARRGGRGASGSSAVGAAVDVGRAHRRADAGPAGGAGPHQRAAAAVPAAHAPAGAAT